MADPLQSIISDILAELGQAPQKPDLNRPLQGVFKSVSDALSAARKAHELLVVMPLEKRREIIANIRRRCAEQVE